MTRYATRDRVTLGSTGRWPSIYNFGEPPKFAGGPPALPGNGAVARRLSI